MLENGVEVIWVLHWMPEIWARGIWRKPMFTPEEIQARLRQVPFRPLRIIVSEGMQFDIDHPELVFVGRCDIAIGTPDPQTPTIYDRMIRVALVHVVTLEDLPATQPSASNGPPG
jgi:hypothetical protein